MKRSGYVLLLLTVLSAGSTWPQSDTASGGSDTLGRSTASTILSVSSNQSGVRVMIDSSMIGMAPIEGVLIRPGKRILRLLPPDSLTWSQEVVIETLSVVSGERIRRDAAFLPVYFISTDPYGADVYARDSLLGETPLRSSIAPGLIRILKPGYDSASFLLRPGGGAVDLTLHPLGGTVSQPVVPYLSSDGSKSPLGLYLASGVAVIGGAAAAYFKIKADGAYGDYLATGDGSTLSRVHRFDLASGISLAACQAGLGILAYLLFTH